jgi:hypothetical protein
LVLVVGPLAAAHLADGIHAAQLARLQVCEGAFS